MITTQSESNGIFVLYIIINSELLPSWASGGFRRQRLGGKRRRRGGGWRHGWHVARGGELRRSVPRAKLRSPRRPSGASFRDRRGDCRASLEGGESESPSLSISSGRSSGWRMDLDPALSRWDRRSSAALTRFYSWGMGMREISVTCFVFHKGGVEIDIFMILGLERKSQGQIGL